MPNYLQKLSFSVDAETYYQKESNIFVKLQL